MTVCICQLQLSLGWELLGIEDWWKTVAWKTNTYLAFTYVILVGVSTQRYLFIFRVLFLLIPSTTRRNLRRTKILCTIKELIFFMLFAVSYCNVECGLSNKLIHHRSCVLWILPLLIWNHDRPRKSLFLSLLVVAQRMTVCSLLPSPRFVRKTQSIS